MEGESWTDIDLSALKVGYDEFETTVLYKQWPLIEEIPCPECDAMLMTLEEVVAHCVALHNWEERNRRNMNKLIQMKDLPDPQTMLMGLRLEEIRLSTQEYSEAAGTYNSVEPIAEVKLEPIDHLELNM